MNRHINHIILWALVIVLMTACGGGGSDVPSPAPTPTPTPTNPTTPTTPDPDPTPTPTPEPQEVPIGFKADLLDAVATTRSAGDGVLDDDGLKAKGFGVFCWYTGGNLVPTTFTDEDHIMNYAENELMRNQKVEWKKWEGNEKSWNYTPSKYWPLNTAEYLTFRAYAPYTDYIRTDAHGMPMLPVVVKSDDYSKGTQQDPLWGTGKLLQTTGDNAGEYFPLPVNPTAEQLKEYYRFGSHYDNITYPMSGTYRLNKTTDPTEGTIHWYFHHGMAKLVFSAKLEGNAADENVYITSIKIGPLYANGLLDISSPATQSSDKPTWDISKSTDIPDVILEGGENKDLTNYIINKTGLTVLTGAGLLIIPRNYNSPNTPMTITVSYKRNLNDVTEYTVTTKINNREFKGNTVYTLNLTVGSALVADITAVNIAFNLWIDETPKDYEVYNW